jgi:hypothetical protein
MALGSLIYIDSHPPTLRPRHPSGHKVWSRISNAFVSPSLLCAVLCTAGGFEFIKRHCISLRGCRMRLFCCDLGRILFCTVLSCAIQENIKSLLFCVDVEQLCHPEGRAYIYDVLIFRRWGVYVALDRRKWQLVSTLYSSPCISTVLSLRRSDWWGM